MRFLFLLPLAAATFREQSIGAKGFVSCRGVRQPGVFVQLYDEDSIIPFDSDDLMGSTTADGLGHFCVKGTASEVSDIDPYVLIEHNCGYEGLGEKTNFFYYLSKEFIVEGNVSRLIENLGEIELLTADAPIQEFKKKHHHHRHLHYSQRERIDQCIPLYVTYKEFFETEVFGTGKESVRVLDSSHDEVGIIDVGEIEKEGEGQEAVIVERTEIKEINHVEIEEEKKRIEEERLREEEERRREEEERKREEEERKREEEERKREEEERLREEKRRLEEEERLKEEERRREEERRLEEERRKEEERRREEERRKEEEERKKEEERRREEYEKAMEDYKRREEERRLEIQRREEARRQGVKVETATSQTKMEIDDHDDPCYRIKRGVRLDVNDPCYRRLRG